MLKDIGPTCAGIEMNLGSHFFEGNIPDKDWTFVSRLKSAGVFFVGVTNTCELGLGLSTESKRHGNTCNPWDLNKTAGGSSGGAAAAVMAAMSPLASGGDAFGSIRVPASCCGVVGLKPSRGLNSLGPIVPDLMSGLVSVGVVSRSVRDQAAALSVTSGPGLGDQRYFEATDYLKMLSEPVKEPYNIAICYDLGSSTPVDDLCKEAIDKTAKLCESLGHRLIWDSPNIDLKKGQKVFECMAAVDTAQCLAAHPGTGLPASKENVESVVWQAAQQGRQMTALQIAQAEIEKHQISNQLAIFLDKYDFVIVPTVAQLPVDLGWLPTSVEDLDVYWSRIHRFAPFCLPFNLSGQPAISLPLGRQPVTQLPVGVQIASAYGQDGKLLRFAHQLEQVSGWPKTLPK